MKNTKRRNYILGSMILKYLHVSFRKKKKTRDDVLLPLNWFGKKTFVSNNLVFIVRFSRIFLHLLLTDQDNLAVAFHILPTDKIKLISNFSNKWIMKPNFAQTTPFKSFSILVVKNKTRALFFVCQQCSRCLATHIARWLKNGGALPIFHANSSYFEDSEIQSSNFQWVDLA